MESERSKTQAAGERLRLNGNTYALQLGRDTSLVPSSTTPAGEDETAATPEMIRSRRNQLKRYMDQLILSKVGDIIVLPGYRRAAGTEFKDLEYGVTKKVRVLYSELWGKPYFWPDIDPQLRTAIKAEFPLGDPEPGGSWYRWAPWGAVLAAAMFLPLASLGYKRTLNENLNLYYVTEYQGQLGHVGAVVSTRAKARFNKDRGEIPNEGSGRAEDRSDAAPEAWRGERGFSDSRRSDDRFGAHTRDTNGRSMGNRQTSQSMPPETSTDDLDDNAHKSYLSRDSDVNRPSGDSHPHKGLSQEGEAEPVNGDHDHSHQNTMNWEPFEEALEMSVPSTEYETEPTVGTLSNTVGIDAEYPESDVVSRKEF